MKLYHNIIRRIIKLNKELWQNSNNLLFVFFEKLMKQVAAATIIQVSYILMKRVLFDFLIDEL